MSNEQRNVVKKEDNLPTANLFEADAQNGLENMEQQDLALPFLRILGQLSPQVNKRDAKYVEGAEPGMIYNTVTGELYDGEKGINVIPAHYKREYVEWQDRGEGAGAPVGVHAATSAIIQEANRDSTGKDRLKNGNYLENTASYFVIVCKEDSAETALITMKSTQLKVSRTWNSMMSGLKLQGKNGLFNPPSFSQVYKLTVTRESSKDYTWGGWVIEFVEVLNPSKNLKTLQSTQAFYESAMKSDIFGKVNFDDENQSQGNNQTKSANESVPF